MRLARISAIAAAAAVAIAAGITVELLDDIASYSNPTLATANQAPINSPKLPQSPVVDGPQIRQASYQVPAATPPQQQAPQKANERYVYRPAQ